MTLTYYLITRAVLISLFLAYIFYLARSGKWENSGHLLLFPLISLLPCISEVFIATYLISITIDSVVEGIGAIIFFVTNFLNGRIESYSRERSFAIRAEQFRDSPTSGQLGVVDEAGGLAVVDGKNIGKLAVADSIRERLGVATRGICNDLLYR